MSQSQTDPFEIVDPALPVARPIAGNQPPPQRSEAERALTAYSLVFPVSSFDLSSQLGKIAAFNASAQADFDLATMEDAEIELVGYHLFLGWMEGIDPKAIIRFALVDADNQTFGGASEGIVRSLIGLVKLFGPAPWAPPIRIRMKAVVNPSTKRTFHTLKIVTQSV